MGGGVKQQVESVMVTKGRIRRNDRIGNFPSMYSTSVKKRQNGGDEGIKGV